MDSRERLAALIYPIVAGPWVGPGYIPKIVESEAIAGAILASDWLRDTLAAEQQRIVWKLHGCAEYVCKYSDSAHCICASDLRFIRNLGPEASYDRG